MAMAYVEQLSGGVHDLDDPRRGGNLLGGPQTDALLGDSQAAARETLRAQVGRLERELSVLVARAFPHVVPVQERTPPRVPRMLGLAELERTRDRLASRIADTQRQLRERRELEQRSRELLRRARLEPGRHKFLRIPLADLGEGTCGAWEVRPRLGPIGMVAGWWQVKLSSGCP
jgi:hypothetical protein